MSKECKKCGHVAELSPEQTSCPNCGAIYAAVEALLAQGKPFVTLKTPEALAAEQAQALQVRIRQGWITGHWDGVPQAVVDAERHKVLLTTTETLPHVQIVDVVNIVSAESVCGVNVIEDYFLAITDLLGGRSKTAQKVLQEAKRSVTLDLKAEAFAVGADAVVAVRFNYSEVSGKNKSMLLVAATGTAVKTHRVNR